MEPNLKNKFNKSKLINGTKPSNQKNKPNEASTQQPQQKNKKAKRLPWNTDVLYDRITPQPYQVQIIDECTSQQNQNSIIFMKTDEWKNYYKMMIIRQFALKTITIKKLFILITNMGSDVSKEVEIVSRHTMLKIAGIDFNLINDQTELKTEKYCSKLKNEAQILIMSVNTLVEWFKRSYLTQNEILLIVFDDVNAAFHNDSYKLLMDSYLTEKTLNIIGFATLCIELQTTHKQLIKHIDYLKHLFKCDYVETATDLLDTHNLFHGIEPSENIQIVDNVKNTFTEPIQQDNSTNKPMDSDKFQSKLIQIIKETYQFLDDFTAGAPIDSLAYIHQLCNRVLNECIYLINEVGVWCFAKSLLPFICQLDKLSSYIESSINKTKRDDSEIKFIDDSNLQQQIILQYTSTSLRRIRELCIKQFLLSKNYNHLQKLKSPQINSLDSFIKNFTTPKVNSLIELLRQYKQTSDEFCCLVFVQNKQVATSLSLLLKKLAKEDPILNYLYPNYVIGATANEPQAKQATNSSSPTSFNSKFSETKTISSFLQKDDSNQTAPNSDCLKQEEILRKFYSGDINLLICTYEMEEHISVPACVNLIIRFNCHTISNQEESSNSFSFNYFSYIGTKSRAQSRNANCYYFIEKSKFDSFFQQFIRCKQIEQTLSKQYSKLIQTNKANTIATTANKTSLSLSNSIQIINKYCIRLPSDALTQLTARSIIETRDQFFKCTYYLPINSGCRQSIESDWEQNIDTARAAAAYRACLVLYDNNELSDQLDPITKELFYKQNNKSDADDEREWSQFSAYFHKINTGCPLSQQQISNYMSHRPGGNKRKQTYTKKVSSFIKLNQMITTQHQCYLYSFKLTLTTPLLNQSETSSQSWCFGLIANKVLLEIVDFPIFTQNGEETVTVELVRNGLFLTPNQLKLIKTFHKFLFSNVLRMEGCGAVPLPYLFDSIKNIQAYGCYICILTNVHDIDWDIMRTIEACNDKQFLKIPQHAKRIDDETGQTINDFKFEESRYTDAVVIPFYRSNDIQPQFYCVSSIDRTTTPLSSFPISSSTSNASQYETFYQYFALKYNYLISNIEQPMLVVSHPSTRLNLLTPRYMNMKTNVIQKSYHFQPSSTTVRSTSKKANSSKIFLVPELVNIHPLSATVWRRSLCLPSILYRLNSLLLAEELRREIAQATGVGDPWHSDMHKFDKLSFHWDKNKEIEISDVPDLEVDAATINQQRKQDDDLIKTNNDNITNDSRWNFEISEWDDSVLLNKKADKTMSSNGWGDLIFDPKTLFIDPNEMDLLVEDEYYMEESDAENVEDDEMFKPNNQANNLDLNSNDDDSLDDDDEDKPKSQFIIDLDKLKADLRKKSAKLLSKLSVNSSSCNLIKNLSNETKAEFDLDEISTDFQLDLNEDLLSQTNTKTNKIDLSQLLDEQALECIEKINIKFDSDYLKNETVHLVEQLKQKQKIKENKIETTFSSIKYKQLSIPLIKTEIIDLLKMNKQAPKSAIDTSNWTGTTTTSFRNTDWTFDFSLDDSTFNDSGPGPALLLQALTLSNAADGFDLERLETVGDSFLKQAITVYLFLTYPNVHEGKLSYLRSKQVSNYNLYKLGKRKSLQELIISTKFEPLESWLPLHYDSQISLNSTAKPLLSNSSASQVLSSLLNKSRAKSPEPVVQFDKYKDHILSDKSIADCVEAIIGAYLITSGPQAALKIMSWFDLKVLPRAKCEDGSEVLVNMPDIPEPVVNDPELLRSLLDGYASFEACIGYKFKQPVYLLQAFTHASYTYNTITDCYQRLEFLGDAILDYVITRHLYEDKKRHSPGELTDLRSSLVNNNIFAHLAVKYEFYKYFRYLSPTLFTIIDNFVRNQKKRNDEFDLDEDFFDYQLDDEDDDIEEEEFILMEEETDSKETSPDGTPIQQSNELEEMEVPKCLGDIFESVAGAIFLDSGKSFDTVWRVYYGLMKPHIDKFTNQVPKSPIRELFELEPETAKFEKPERTIDGKIRVTVSVFGRGKFKGVGRNYRIAKNAAAKLALKFLKNQK